MDDATLQRKLNKLCSLANELAEEAKRRYGPEGFLFYEAEGTFHIMAGDVDGSSAERQKFVRMSSDKYCRMDCGAW